MSTSDTLLSHWGLPAARCVEPDVFHHIPRTLRATPHGPGSTRVCAAGAGPSRAPAVFVWPAAVPQNTAALIRAAHLAPDKSSSVAGIWPIPALSNWSQPSDRAGSDRGRLLIPSTGEGEKGDDASRQGEEQAAEMDYGA